MEDARQRILDSAKAIFLEQGYKKTTIRQIVQRSGLLIGSIYHFFENKEDIFCQLFLNVFDRCDGLIAQRYGASADPPFRLALMFAVMLQAAELNGNICELYYEGFTLPLASEQHALQFERWLSENLNVPAEGDRAYVCALAIHGVLRALLAGHGYERRLPLTDSIRVMTESSFAILGLPPARAAEVVGRLQAQQPVLVSIAEELAERSLA